MDSKANDQSNTGESAPLISPRDCDDELFMVPLKRPSPRELPSRFRNVQPRTPPRSPAVRSPHSSLVKSPQSGRIFGGSPYQSPAFSGRTTKPDSPSMFISPLMSPETGAIGPDGTPNPLYMATPGSLLFGSPPISIRAARTGSSPNISSGKNSARQSPEPQSSSKQNPTSASRSTSEKPNTSTQATSVEGTPPAQTDGKAAGVPADAQPSAPEIPPLSAARGLRTPAQPTATTSRNLGLALHLNNDTGNPNNLLSPPLPSSKTIKSPRAGVGDAEWTVPDSPLERLSQVRATPDSAYDRARQMEVRRSEWKHVVYRFPVKGREDWVIDADLTESSHARLADVARRSSEGFEWNGDYELANIYRVLAAAHARAMEEMRAERRGVAA